MVIKFRRKYLIFALYLLLFLSAGLIITHNLSHPRSSITTPVNPPEVSNTSPENPESDPNSDPNPDSDSASGDSSSNSAASKIFQPEAEITPETLPDLPSQPQKVLLAQNQKRSFINLQPTVDAWIASLPASTTAGVYIYDLSFGQMAASYNLNQTFRTRSLYKLFLAIAGYQMANEGVLNLNDHYANLSGHDYTVGSCLDVMIRNSNNPCGEAMYDDERFRERVQGLISHLGLSATAEYGLSSTPENIGRLMQYVWNHAGLSSTSSWDKFANSLLYQPATYRRGLPSGLTSAQVYTKVGWGGISGGAWQQYHEASIVSFNSLNHHYIMVVMTNNLPSWSYFVQLGQQINQKVQSESWIYEYVYL